MAKNNDIKKIFDLALLRRIFSFTAPYKGSFYLSIFLSIVLAIAAPLRPWLIQLSVDKYISNKLLEGLIWISVIQLGILLVDSLLRFWFMYLISWLGQTVVNDMRKKVFRKVLFQDIAYYDRTPIGTLTTRTINDLEAVNEVFGQGVISIIADVLTIIAIIIVMLVTDWKLALVCLTTFPAIILATYIFKESVNKSFQRVRNAVASLNAFVQEHIVGMYIVQAFGAEQREGDKFKQINKEHRDANIKAIFAYSVFFPVVEIIATIAIALLVWWGAVRMMHFETSPGVIIAFVMYLNLLFRPLRMLADKFNVLQMGMVAAERVFGVLDSKENLHNKGTHKLEKIAGSVVFDEVHFSYKQDIPVLKGVSFELDKGKTLAVVGHTGAGKTSIISLLSRIYEVNRGSIKIDGTDIRDYDVHNLRGHIGIVLQDVFLFSGSVFDNITLRNKDISMEEVQRVTKMLGMHEHIMKLPGGYDFNVMERGSSMSQGQRQLLSFARALLYNPSILILDEATSSVDSESEQLIQHAIDTMIQGRTSIVIAHRLSTIRKADEIIVLEKGRIIEQGNHKQLLEKKGAYYDLYTAVEKQKEEVL
ncbi:MAG TPA: ABC transporter ATP-binding protein [Flavipsychrobacter sp.]